MNKRRILCMLLAILMVISLLPTAALAAGKGKTTNVTQTVKIGGKSVKVALKGVPEGTRLKLTSPKKSTYKNAVKAAVEGDYEIVLAVKAGVSPKLKKAVKATVTAAVLKGLKASEIRLFRISGETAKEIRNFKLSGKELTFSSKAYGTLVVVKAAAPEEEEPQEEPGDEPAEEPESVTETLGDVAVSVTGAPEGAVLTLGEAAEESVAMTLNEGDEAVLALDIALEPSELETPVTVAVSAPALEGLADSGLTLYHIKNGAAESVSFTLAGGVLTFATASFSDFVLVKAADAPPAEGEEEGEESGSEEPAGEGTDRQTFTITVQLENRLTGNMWEGAVDIRGNVQDSFPDSVTISFSLADQETISCNAADAAQTLLSLCQDEVTTGTFALRTFMIYNGSQNQPLNTETAFMNDGGTLKYKQGTSGANWKVWSEANYVTMRFFPKYMLVKVDPNTSDVDVVGASLVTGTLTINGVDYSGVQYIRFVQTGDITSDNNAPYKIENAADKPTKATFMDLSTTSFTHWETKNFNAYNFNNTMNIYRGTLTDNNHYVYNVPRRPGLTATYSLPANDLTNNAPIYPNTSIPGTDSRGYPLVNGKTQGTVTGEKTADWVQIDASIAKITLSVSGVPLYKGSDVVIVLDRSGSMGGRYRLDHPDLESYTKKATLDAIDILLTDSFYNNRVAIVNFSEANATGVGLGFRTTNEKQAVVDYMRKWTVHNGATSTYNGMNAAYQLLQNRSDTEKRNRRGIILFLTDGIPNPDKPYPDGQRPTENFLNSIGANYELYTIGMKLPAGPAGDLASWARPQDDEHSENVDDPAELSGVFQDIAHRILAAGRNAAFADAMSVYFDAVTPAELEALNEEHGWDYHNSEGVVVSDDGQSISVNVGEITSEPKVYEFYIKIDEDPAMYESVGTGWCPTNESVSLTYTDTDGNIQVLTGDDLGNPKLTRGNTGMIFRYYRVNEEGHYVNSDGIEVTDSEKSQAFVGSEIVNLLLLEIVSDEDYKAYADGGPNVNNEQNKVWGKIPGGYALWDQEDEYKTVTINTNYSLTYDVEFKVIAPVSISKARVDDADHLNGTECIGYAVGEEVPYVVTVTNNSNVEMTNVKVVDKAVVPASGYSPVATGTFTFDGATDGDDAQITGVTYDASTHTFTIATLPAQGTVKLLYHYTVPAADIGKQIENWAQVMGKTSNVVITPTRILVQKVWVNDTEADRPAGVVITLVADNVPTSETITLTANGNWKGGFKVDNAETIYTVAETPIANYSTEISGSPSAGFTVTNTMQEFYIYHSSDKVVERVPMSACTDGKYDITAKIKDGTLYGGYFQTYQKKSKTYTGGLTGLGTGNVDTQGTAYNASHCGLGYWQKLKAYTAGGAAMTPVAGTTYYLKEVPVNFFKPYMSVVYDTHNNNKVTRIYLITGVDDLNYTNVGLTVKNGSGQAMDIGTRLALATSFTITQNGATYSTITAADSFEVAAGLVAVWQLPEVPASAATFSIDSVNYTTPDGVNGTGLYKRTVNMGNGNVNIVDGQVTMATGSGPGLTISDTGIN